MKKILQSYLNRSFLVGLISFCSSVIFAQSYCETPSITKYIKENNDLKQMAVNANHYCLRVYFHVITTQDGFGDQTPATVAQAFQILNNDFAPHNISFFWDGVIDFIPASPDSPVLEFPSTCPPCTSCTQPIFSMNNHNDGIDIYLYSDFRASKWSW